MDLDIELLALLKCKGGGGGASVTIEPLTITENGTTTAPEGKAYSPVTVDVPNPSAGELEITENGTYDVMEKASAVVNVPQYLGYLTFSNIAYLSVAAPVWNGTMYISNDAEQWSVWKGLRFESGDDHEIYLRGRGNTALFKNDHSLSFNAYDSSAGGVICKGNIENLLDAPTVARGNHPEMAVNCYSNMFKGCTSLTTAPELPATTTVSSCYAHMFNGCTSLTTAPELPATTTASNCYAGMFSGCTSLTTAPALPATLLSYQCYKDMFKGCTSLAAAPSLPAMTLASQCYYSMFQGCTSLTTAPVLPATTLKEQCYRYMFKDCTGIKLSTTNDGDYTTPYRIPASGKGTTATNALESMFASTGGTFTGTPKINTTYYTSNTVV